MFRLVAIDLYVVHGSHPCAAVERALEMKGLPFRRIELPPPLHAPLQFARFGTRTVPAMRLEDGEKVAGSRAILRRLDDIAPAPPLWPSDAEARALVERAEEWGDEVYQPIARRLLWGALRRCPEALVSYSEGSGIRLPAVAVRADLRNLPRHLDRVDRWLGEGVIGGPAPNAADLQIAATSRLLLTIGDVTPFFGGRPAEAHAHRLFPAHAGSTPRGVFPGAWVAGSPAQR